MAKVKATARQAEIKRLLDGGAEVGEIAVLQRTTPQAVYSQISRMRARGLLPKASRPRGGRVKTSARNRSPVVKLPPANVEPPAAPPNGSVTLEEHMAAELERVVLRLVEIDAGMTALGEERADLDQRKSRLEAANSHLTGAQPPAEGAQAPAEAAA